MFRSGASLLILLALVLAIARADLAAGESGARPLVVVDDRAYPPFAFLDGNGQAQGITIDLWRLWSRHTGVPVEFRLLPWDDALAAVKTGQADALGGCFQTPAREQDFAFVRFGVDIPTGIFFHKRITGVRGIGDVARFRVGVVAGDLGEELMRGKAESLATFPGVDQMVEAALAGTINVFVADSQPAWYYLLSHPGGDDFRQAATDVAVNRECPAVRAGNLELLARLQAGFDAIPAEEIQRVVTTWTGRDATAGIAWQVVGGVIASALLLALGVMIWNASLRRRVNATTADLRESEERFRRVIERAPEAITLIDPLRGVFVEANPRAEIIYGVPHDRIIEASPAAFSPERQPDGEMSEAKSRRMLGAALAGSEQVFPWLHRRPDGSEVPCEVRLVPLPWQGRTLVRASLIDLSDRRHAEEVRRRTEKALALGELAGGVAHDFNNVLAGILGYADLISNRTADAKAQAYAGKISAAVAQAQALTSRLLAFARKGVTVPEPFDAHGAVCNALDLFSAARPQGVVVTRKLDAGASQVRGFPGLFQNAILNLCFNAWDAMAQGGNLIVSSGIETFDATSTRRLAPYVILPGEHWHLTIADDGAGMPPEILARCLEPLFTTKGDKGTGLGLPGVHVCMVEHHGAMRIDSEPGRGTTVHLWLPLIPAEGSVPATLLGKASGDLRTGLVLVVDDEPGICQNTTELLSGFGYRVRGLPDGEDAVAWVKAHPGEAALVLLDMHMPGLDGARTFAALHELAPDLPVILTSGSTGELDVDSMLRMGLRGMLRKPTNAQTLLDAVSSIVRPGST